MRTAWNSLIAVSLLLGATSLLAAEPIFSFKGKSYSRDDFPVSLQNRYFELQNDFHERANAVVDDAIIEMHITELVNKQGKSRQAVESSLFTTKEPSEKEIKEWYDANKGRIPYPFEKIKGDIKNLLQAEQKRDQKKDLVAKLKKEGKFKSMVAEPAAPVIKVNYAGRPMKGNPKAKVVLVEFADYQCPHCKHADETMKQVMAKYKDKIALYYIDFPINRSGISTEVAEGAYCAMKQDKYWEFHEKAFEEQAELTNEWPVKMAERLKLKMDDFKTCLKSDEARKFVASGKSEGDRVGVGGTPSMFINGRKIKGHDLESISAEIDQALKATGA